jgi:hypothetical protein
MERTTQTSPTMWGLFTRDCMGIKASGNANISEESEPELSKT